MTSVSRSRFIPRGSVNAVVRRSSVTASDAHHSKVSLTGPFGNLTIQDVATIDDIQIGMGLDARNIVNVGLMSDGLPVIACQSKSKTSIARWEAGVFDLEVLVAADGVRLRQQVSMAVDDADRVHLAFWQGEGAGQVCYGRI